MMEHGGWVYRPTAGAANETFEWSQAHSYCQTRFTVTLTSVDTLARFDAARRGATAQMSDHEIYLRLFFAQLLRHGAND
jgi:hypothetical protein